MLLRRYGTSVESVETNFQSKALTEIGFRRDRRLSIPTDEFREDWERVALHELTARAEGDVQDETEQKLLADLQAQIDALLEGLDEDHVLLVESDQGADYPKTRSTQRNVVVDGENRLRFELGVRPPLRVGVYRRTAGR